MSIIIDAARNYGGRSIDLYVFNAHNPGQFEGSTQVEIATNVEFTTTEPMSIRDPSLRLDFDAARNLMDALWACNIRPTEEGTAGQISALQAHLQDMRRLVFDEHQGKDNQ